MDEMLKDPRFAHVAKDPKFRRIPKAERKVKIDHRFKDMFQDKKFTVKYTVDKRGRPLNQTTTEDLRKYYDLSSSEDEDASTSSENQKIKKKKKKKEKTRDTEKQSNDKRRIDLTKKANLSFVREVPSDEESKTDESDESTDNESDSLDDNEDIEEAIPQLDVEENNKQLYKRRKDESGKLTSEVKERLKDLSVNYARGEGILLTDSSSEEESSEDGGTVFFPILLFLNVSRHNIEYIKFIFVMFCRCGG